MEKRLADYIQQFETLLNFSNMCWWIIDYKNDSGHYYCNELMEDTFMLDKSAEKHSVSQTCPIAGDYIKNVKLASSKQANLIIKEYLELINQEKKEYSNTFPYHDIRTNEISYFSSKAKVLETDENGETSIIFGIIENITNRETQAKELKEYHDIIDKYVMTSTTDTNGIMTSVSKSFCQKTGFSKEELIGSKYSILRHPDISTKIYKKIWRRLKSGQAWEGELKNIKKDGTVYWIRLIISPNFDDKQNIRAYTTVYEDITDKKIIEKLSNRDKLTNVYNRGKLDTLLERELKRSLRYNIDLSVILLDIDFFKSINDRYGHITGDKVLIQIASILKELTRVNDFIGRWGGEEFLIICPNSNKTQAHSVALKIKNFLEEFDFGIDTIITASFGISTYKKNDTIDTILQRADKTLYKAKDNGRNRIEIEE